MSDADTPSSDFGNLGQTPYSSGDGYGPSVPTPEPMGYGAGFAGDTQTPQFGTGFPQPQSSAQYGGDFSQSQPYGVEYPTHAGLEVVPSVYELVPEQVGKGVLFSLISIPIGVALTVVIWQLGFFASISSFALSALAVWLYSKGSGGQLKRGVVPLILVIVAGVALSIFGIVFSDVVVELMNYAPDAPLSEVLSYAFSLLMSVPEIWGDYAGSIAMFILFALLGAGGTLFNLVRANRTKATA
ncbi:MAG: hypothetical protein LBU38_03550 [Propionibacteriaceae bacterium]|jgi:hypothetical protein|nr:hypothetical protein [Propionibacteriaceae bacterium]